MIAICMVVTWSKYGAGLIGRLTLAQSISIRRRSVENWTWDAIRFDVLREFWIHRETLSFSDISLARISSSSQCKFPTVQTVVRGIYLSIEWSSSMRESASIEYVRRVEQRLKVTTRWNARAILALTLFFHGSRAAAQLLSATSHARVI